MAARAWTLGALCDETDHPSAALPDFAKEEDALSDAQAFGMEVGIVRDAIKASQSVSLNGMVYEGIFEVNLKALKAFVSVCNQWRMAGGKFLSIDYASARIAWDAHGLTLDGDDFSKMQMIEAWAARILNGGAE